jgi:succinyl-CoA synthetase alpha subunit
MVSYAMKNDAKILGPGSLGIISPGKAAMGWLGGSVDWAKMLFEPGPVGVISRSGGQSGTVPWALKVAGLGISTAMHIGTEPVLGLTMADVLKLFEKDEQTKAVAIFGEIGGTLEEEAAEAVDNGEFTKPLVVFIAGAWAPEGMRFSHASSIVERGRGTAQGKIKALKAAGAHVVDSPEEIAPKINELISV